MTEDALLSAVIALAQAAGYRVAHFRPARTAKGWRTLMQGDTGWPDIIICGRGRFIVAELKAAKGTTRPDQIAWLEALSEAGIECYVWRPEHWETGAIAEVLGCGGGVIPPKEGAA